MSAPPSAPPPKLPVLRAIVDRLTKEAVLLRDESALVVNARGLQGRPFRLDLRISALPLIEWDVNLVGQYGFLLTAQHHWANVLVTHAWRGPGGRVTHSLRMIDGGATVTQMLPDHRFALHAEMDRDVITPPLAAPAVAAPAVAASAAAAPLLPPGSVGTPAAPSWMFLRSVSSG